MVFEIIKNVPIPEKGKPSIGHPSKYPFPDMEVGDSFRVPVDKKKLDSEQRNAMLRQACNWSARHKGGKFTARIIDDAGKKYISVWRIS